jgi:hypothetical protein
MTQQQRSNDGLVGNSDDDDRGRLSGTVPPPPPPEDELSSGEDEYYWQRLGGVPDRSATSQEDRTDDDDNDDAGQVLTGLLQAIALRPEDTTTPDDELVISWQYDSIDDGENEQTTFKYGMFFRTKPYSNTGHTLNEDVNDANDSPLDCSICLQEITTSDTVGDIPCNHMFHKGCLKAWLVRHNRCPLCQRWKIAKEWDELSSSAGSDVTSIRDEDIVDRPDSGPSVVFLDWPRSTSSVDTLSHLVDRMVA